jgi:hypothetical protein
MFPGNFLQFIIGQIVARQSVADDIESKALFGLELHQGSSGKIHPQIPPSAFDLHEGRETKDDKGPGKHKCRIFQPNEIDAGVSNEMQESKRFEAALEVKPRGCRKGR